MHSPGGVVTRFAFALVVSTCALVAGPALGAGSDPQLEGIVVTGDRPATAPYEAPTQGSLDAGQPQSVINQHFIENNLTPSANYTDIINIAPSVVDTTPNGAGNAESLNMSIRGLQDGQFNVTFDGIPWNDSNDFTHHSTSYFTADTIGGVTVDRGPGTASQVGNATFGGTVALQSKDPLTSHNVSPSVTFGSFHTNDYAVQIDTGTLAQAGGGRGMLTLTSINTDGAMTNNGLERKNAFFKYVQPAGPDTTMTAVAMYNTLHQNVAQMGTTQPMLNQFGENFSMSAIPSSDSYYGYNFDDIHTDFEYFDFKTRRDGFRLDEKVYTYGYYHKINETNDTSITTSPVGSNPNGASFVPGTQLSGSLVPYCTVGGNPCNTAALAAPFNPTDVGGQKGFNNYRSWGDVLKVDYDLGPGTLRGGLWVDYQWNDRALWDVDWTLGGVIVPWQDSNGFQREMHDTLTTLAPFVEYEYRPIEDLSITPGLRYTSFKRALDAVVNQNAEVPLDFSHTWTGAQPSVYALYHIRSDWSAYAQYARGFLAPNLNLLYHTSPSAVDAIAPDLTDNLQAGTTWKTERLTLSADVYHIKFSNFLSVGGSGSVVVVKHGGGAIFKGEEFEGTFVVGAGFSLYGNISHNDATYDDGTPVLNAPSGTSALGVIYDNGSLYGSLISKHVGSQTEGGNNGPLLGALKGDYLISGYTINNLAVGYTLRELGAGFKDLKLRFEVANLSNKTSIYYVYGASLDGTQDAFMTLPGRAYSLGISADF